MKIAVNVRLLLKDRLEGIGNFTEQIFLRLAALRPQDDFYFIFDREPHPSFYDLPNIHPLVLSPPTRHPLLYVYWFQWALPRLLKKLSVHLFISPDGNLALPYSGKQLAVIHDINFHHRPEDLPWAYARYYNYFFPRFGQKANRLVTVSDYSRQDIASSYHLDSASIDVVYNGAFQWIRPLSSEEASDWRALHTGGKLYFLYVGSVHPRKNIPNLIQAFEGFKDRTGSDFQLVLAGAPMFRKGTASLSVSERYKKDIHFTGRLTREALANYYGAAYALVYVPYFEGFGMPVLEAMQARIPIITSKVTSLPEVAGDASLQVDPGRVDEIIAAMIRLYDDTSLVKKLVEAGDDQKERFKWEESALKFNEIIESLLSEQAD